MAEQEKSKGFSLRKKGARRHGFQRDGKEIQISDPIPKTSFEPPGGRPGTANSTDPRARPRGPPTQATEIVKKRHSIRYNQLPQSGQEAPPVPAIPNLLPSGGRDGAPGQGPDLRALRDPDFDPDRYLAQFMANASEKVEELERELTKNKNRVSADIQHNVYQNRTQFIKISKEAEKLKNEMQTLRGLMNDLTVTLAQASATTGQQTAAEEGARKKDRRTSVANLEAMWNTQLQTLWKSIEGSQKFIPAVPGRHIVMEQGHWQELDAATWKARRHVHMVLLNDHLLIAAKKRKRIDPNAPKTPEKAATKLVAEHCFPIRDVDLVDLSSTSTKSKSSKEFAEIANAVALRHGQDVFTYRSDRPTMKDKTELLQAVKRTEEELRRAERADLDESSKAKEAMNYLATRDPAASNSNGLLRTLSKSRERSEILIDVDGKQRNLRWVEAQIDELDIEVALQRFDDAVNRVEQLRRFAKTLKVNTAAQDLIAAKVDERAGKLADLLIQGLGNAHSSLTEIQRTTAYLTRLEYTSRARAAYLAARRDHLHAQARRCIFEGDTMKHVTHISYIYFTLIKNTVSIYQQCFRPDTMSACVVWAKERLDEFNEALKHALSRTERDGAMSREALQKSREMASIMDEVGLDFKRLIGSDIVEH